MYPSEYFEKLRKSISYPVKITFTSSMTIGIIVHLFMITNMFPNHDSVSIINNIFLVSLVGGRWFAFIPDFLSTDYFLPWISGLLSIFYISISGCLIIKCLRINNSLNCILISGLMTSFPTVVCSLTYHTSDIMISALLLACLAIYITQRFRYGFCIGFIFIAMSLGVYQAYFSVAAGLSVGILIVDIIQDKISLREIIIKGIKLFSTLLLGIILYFLMIKVTLSIYKMGLLTYQNMNEMGKIPISIIPGLIKKAYTSIVNFFIRDAYGLHRAPYFFMKYAFYVVTIMSVAFLMIIIIQKKFIKKGMRFVLLGFLIILYPLACNIVYLMNPANVYLNMIYGMVLLPILIIVLIETIQDNSKNKEKRWLFISKRTVCWVISSVFAICIYNYAILANKTYIRMHITYEHAYAYSIELMARIESVDGYSEDIPIFLIGTRAATINEIQQLNEEVAGISGARANLPMSYSYLTFIRNFLGFRDGMVLGDLDLIISYNMEEEFKTMSTYPEPGSIKRINDTMVVKFPAE